MSKVVGMSRNINLDWLDKVVECVQDGLSEKEIKEVLDDYLSDFIKDKTNHNKTRNILLNIWFKKDESNTEIKEYGLKLASSRKHVNKLVAHWCLMMITYSVFHDLVVTIGKLEDKQLSITTKLVREKMLNSWGERTTVIHSIPKNIKTMKDIGILNQLKVGNYETNTFIIEDTKAINLLVATILNLSNKLYVSVDDLVNMAEVFPFKFDLDIESLESSGMFTFDRFGGELVISLDLNSTKLVNTK